ncbi:hypothetical protein OCS_04461 [Ophiocordyceps sinensis CO18]|uniref:Rhodopsin domain-containing protein n=1 Tax=Ophiocordyceps sinensis (strain Co18 / CGMCC 3.14243) TaxID=911162 RepID=T5ADL9_OPHSC|nr:hypothetical protein OCS_04461 [Ophiocordyceps sinensis CO18]
MTPQVSPSPTTFSPSLPAPSGVVPNPRDPASLVGLAGIAAGIGVSFVTVFFLLRTYARVVVKRIWTFEDVLVTISWGGTVAYCAIMRATMSHNGGKHGWDITKAQAHEAAYWFNVASIEYGVMIGMTKLAVLWLYRRVFSPARGSRFDNACLGLVVLIVGFYGSTSVVKIWECEPRQKIWDSSLPGKCLELNWILNISGGFNMVTDFLILLLPVQAVRKLKVNRLKRVLIVLTFTFGLCAPIFATIGFVVRLRNSANPDKTWNQPEILLWGAGELVSGNLCVCFPELPFLFRSKKRAQIRRDRGRRRHPTASQVEAWHEEANKKGPQPSYPYFTKSLMGTAFTGTAATGTTVDQPYVELRDQASVAKAPSA